MKNVYFERSVAIAFNGKHCCQWRIKKNKDEYSTEDNRSTRVECLTFSPHFINTLLAVVAVIQGTTFKTMGYFTWKEDEAYRDGYNDGRYGRRDYFRDEHFGNNEDKAYYDGLREAEREEERRREMYEQERQQEEMEERRREEHRQYMRDLEEQEYYRQMEQEQYPEPPQQDQDDDLPW